MNGSVLLSSAAEADTQWARKMEVRRTDEAAGLGQGKRAGRQHTSPPFMERRQGGSGGVRPPSCYGGVGPRHASPADGERRVGAAALTEPMRKSKPGQRV